MQVMSVDPITGLSIAVAISLALSVFNTFLLWKKGTIGKNDIIMLLKILAALLPQIQNPVVQALMNEVIHAIMERLGLPGKERSIDELLKKIEELSKPRTPPPPPPTPA